MQLKTLILLAVVAFVKISEAQNDLWPSSAEFIKI